MTNKTALLCGALMVGFAILSVLWYGVNYPIYLVGAAICFSIHTTKQTLRAWCIVIYQP